MKKLLDITFKNFDFLGCTDYQQLINVAQRVKTREGKAGLDLCAQIF